MKIEQRDGNQQFDFEQLDVYQLALEFLDAMFRVCRALPQDVRFPLADQLIRAALSISNNLAEGTGKASKKERARYYGTAIDSARECISMLNVLNRQHCLSSEGYTELRGLGRRITAMLYSLIRSLDDPTRTPVHRFTSTRSHGT